MNKRPPTYDELLERVARLERQLEQRGGTALPTNGESSGPGAALDDARATLHAIIESTPDPIWAVDPDGFGLLIFNHSFHDYFLRNRGKTITVGQRPEELLPDGEFVRRWHAFYRRALREGPYTTEYAVYGGTRTLEMSFNLMLREGQAFGISVFGHDITERKAAEEALRKSEEKFRQLTEESPVPIFIIQAGKLVFVNPSLAKFAGYARDEMVGKMAPQELIHRDDVARLMTKLGERAAGKSQGEAVGYRGVRKDGSIVHLEAYATLIEYQGNPAVMGTLIDVTERKRAAERLRENEEFLSFALDTAKIGVWELDLTDMSAHRSTQHDQIFGYDSILPSCTYELFLEHVLPEDRTAVDQCFRDAYATHNDINTEYRITSRTGDTRWLWTAGRHRLDEHGRPRWLVSITQDVTERKGMQDTLRLSEEKYRSLFNNAEVGMFRSRIDGSGLVDFNEKYMELYGLSREEMLGRPTDSYWADPAERAVMVEKLKATGRLTDFECRMVGRNGVVMTCLASARLYPQQGILEGSIIDISALKRAEEERLKVEQQLGQTQRLESLGLLAGGIAHDFNNLMSAVFGHVELALDQAHDKEIADNLTRAMSSMDRARDLPRQLLTFAKGGAPVRTIGPLFPLVEKSARFALSGGSVSCTFDIAADLWPCNFDANQIGQVIGNLVINAQQAMPGPGTIHISARNTRLGISRAGSPQAGDYVVVDIEDRGIGIPPETLPRIFDPFFTTKAKGRGLGLSTCHSISIRHGGAITVDSTPGKGSTFHLYLPAVARAPDVASARIQHNVMVAHRGEGRVLVMDDEQAMQDVFIAMLTSFGYSVQTAADGSVALDLYARAKRVGHTFRAVLLDLTVVGGMGGIETAQRLRSLNSHIPLFVTSGYAEDPVMADPAAYAFTASLRKPFAKKDLAELFERHMPPP